MSELLTCPFCGNEAEFHIYGMMCLVECSECRIGTTIHLIDDYENAIEKWNTRAERTCRNLDKHHNIMFKCSECGHWECQDFDGEKILPQTWNYCPNCGAKVVKR